MLASLIFRGPLPKSHRRRGHAPRHAGAQNHAKDILATGSVHRRGVMQRALGACAFLAVAVGGEMGLVFERFDPDVGQFLENKKNLSDVRVEALKD